VTSSPRRPKVVVIGGGHGLSRALTALRRLDVEPTAVVTVADDGGSSGRLRRDLDIIAPGDLRMALLALAEEERLAAVLAHRFRRGELAGHALGNLLLVALAEQGDDDFVAALAEAGDLLRCTGRVYPATTAPVQLRATVAGRRVEGQASVAKASGRIEQVWLEPAAPPACEAALDAIDGADLVLLGPGSLFTSVIATLLVPGVAKAVAACTAPVVAVVNITTQPGETTGLSCAAHVDALLDHLQGRTLDAVLLHDGPAGVGEGDPVGADLAHPGVGRVVRADLLARDADGRPGSGHDPERLAVAVAGVLAALGRNGGDDGMNRGG
jgi:uncharacterized cofD-like protein